MKTIFVSLLFSCLVATAQSISKQIIGASGTNQNNSTAKLSWTVGEPVVGLMTATGSQLGNGYHQSLNLQTLKIMDNELAIQIKVYPNPTSQALYLSHPDVNTFSIQVIDMNGKLKYTGIINKDIPLDVSSYTTGTYLIKIENKEANLNMIYKIIKE